MANKPPPPPKPKPKPKPKLTVYIKPSTFKQNVMAGRQSNNVIDLRNTLPVRVLGNLTWNTYFHTSSNAAKEVFNALKRRGFIVDGIQFFPKGFFNSDYGFNILLTVNGNFSLDDVRVSVANTLAPLAAPNSIRFTSVNWIIR
jgi:hypothetical protein